MINVCQCILSKEKSVVGRQKGLQKNGALLKGKASLITFPHFYEGIEDEFS